MAYWGRLQNCEKLLLASSCLSVHPSAWNNSAPTGPIFMIFDIGIFFRISVEIIKVSFNFDKNNWYFT